MMRIMNIIERPYRVCSSSVGVFGLLLITGCVTYDAKTPTFEDYPEQQKHPLTVALRLDEDYTSFVCSVAQRGFVVPLGDALERNSVFVAEKTFGKVYLVKGAEADVPPDARAVLTPRINFGSTTRFVSAFDTAEFAIDVEWTLEDRQGDLIWLRTLRGRVRNASGTTGSMRSQAGKRIRPALKELFAATHEAISGSALIREFAKTQ